MGVQYFLSAASSKADGAAAPALGRALPDPVGRGDGAKPRPAAPSFAFPVFFRGGSGYCSISPVISRHSSAGSSIGTPPMRHPSA